jgi:hypothetical protein
MEITQEHDRKIQEIMNGMQCNRDFECYKSGFENLCQVMIIGDAKLVECLEQQAISCKRVFSFGLGYICKCPLRNYIAKNFNR